MTEQKAKKRIGVTVFLNEADHRRLKRVCGRRGQTVSDFLRSAIRHGQDLRIVKSKQPLSGACLERHNARLARERKSKRRK